MSASPIAWARFSNATARAPSAFAMSAVRSAVRLVTIIFATPAPSRLFAVSCPASPAPITSTVFSARSPGPSRASSTAIDETDTGRRPIVVCSRTLRPTRIAVWNSRESAGVCVSACVAAVNAPRT